MDALQATLHDELQEMAHQVLSGLVDQKLRAQDITLSKPQLAVLTEHVLQGKTEFLTLVIGLRAAFVSSVSPCTPRDTSGLRGPHNRASS
jgi:hypothetical protein